MKEIASIFLIVIGIAILNDVQPLELKDIIALILLAYGVYLK